MVIWIAAGLLLVVAIAHSVLGEKFLISPLIASSAWKLPVLSRAYANRLLRFTWHLTTVAWVGLAVALAGTPIDYVFAAVTLGSAAWILGMLPGHVAWPALLTAGLLVLWSVDAMPAWLLWIGVAVGVTVALLAAGFHVAWALGSRRGAANVIPQRPAPAADGTWEPAALPAPALTFAVAVALATYAGLVVANATGAGAPWLGWLLVAALVVLAVRVMGEGKWMGVTKRVRTTGFAHADDRYWTPAAAMLALGAAAALVV